MRTTTWITLALTICIAAVLIACGGGSTTSSKNQPGTVNLSLSDPATCSSTQSGPYKSIYVTITDVQIHASSTAAAGDAGWVDLTPNLKNSPQQVDLLGIANNDCFLASLGSGPQLQPGTYQQMRVILADNGTQLANNKCTGGSVNCVVLSSDNSIQPLQLSSESKTGIKIPSGQLAGGQFTIAAGETKDLNVDINACASIVVEGNGKFRLKPVLHAGEVSLTARSINGKVIDQATGQPVSGGKVVVALELRTTNGTRVIMQTVPDASGNFVFCPVPAGSYEVVASAINGAGAAYGITVASGVSPGNALGNVPLIVQAGASTAPSSITGQITSADTTGAKVIDVNLSAMQSVTAGGNTFLAIIPLAQQSSASVALTTATGGSCAAGVACVSYTLAVPAATPNVGVFNTAGTTYTQTGTVPVKITVSADAFQPSSGNTAVCTPSTQSTSTATPAGDLLVAPGLNPTAATLAFTGCTY